LSVAIGVACSAGLVLAETTVSPSSTSALVNAGASLRVNVAEAVGGKTVFGQLAVAGVTGAGFVTANGCADGIPATAKATSTKPTSTTTAQSPQSPHTGRDAIDVR